jgi:hypothetical protein
LRLNEMFVFKNLKLKEEHRAVLIEIQLLQLNQLTLTQLKTITKQR